MIQLNSPTQHPLKDTVVLARRRRATQPQTRNKTADTIPTPPLRRLSLPICNRNVDSAPSPPVRSKSLSTPSNHPVFVPVFMLPRKDLSTIPENEEIHEGYVVHMSLKPYREQVFVGLMSLSKLDEPDKQIFKESMAKFVKYRSFFCMARAA